MEKKPDVTFVLGGPGCGKGTLCQMIVKKYPDIVHLSAGDLLRAEGKTNSDQAKIINDLINQGKVVPVKISCGLLKKAMIANGWEKKRYLIDGYPRNQDNLDGWNEIIGASAIVKQVLYVECPKDVTMDRLLKRDRGADDQKSVIEKRFKHFDTVEYPMVEYFLKKGMVIKIDGSKTPDNTFEQVKKYFEINFH